MPATSDLTLGNIGVAITRPVNQAKTLTKLIESAGGIVISFPLITITSLDDYSQFEQIITNIDSYDWILFISSNAVQNGMPRLIKQGIPPHLQFAAIGPSTAQTLKDFGINQVLIPEERFDSESLLSLPELHNMKDKKVMLVRGIGGRDVIANTLTERGAQVTFAECYQRINPQTNCNTLEQAVVNEQLHMIVITSSEAMRYLLIMAGESEWIKQVVICVNHARVAEDPIKMGLQVKVADAPGDEAMFTLIKSIPRITGNCI